MSDQADNKLQIASRFINCTNRHVYITGKAGTGKTTFLKEIFASTHKKAVIAAPTGVAAINAGGVTLHSLLQLPFGNFVPTNFPKSIDSIYSKITTPKSLIRESRLGKNKLMLVRELELLIIDEVSMLRADLLDAIDTRLKHARRRSEPFGGVQLLLIGDLLQLPPVVKEHEWKVLSDYYQSPYFFEAKALKENMPVYIELTKVYRQTDQDFINVLEHFRYNKPTRKDLDLLNESCKKFENAKKSREFIFITTHNRIVDEKNATELAKLKEKEFSYNAEIEGDFPEHLYPVEFNLKLKKGARVMFIKNDYSGEQLYFNGKIGTVNNLDEEDIQIGFDDGSSEVRVEKYTWENKSYQVNEDTGEISEKINGTFTHFPLRLAWAVTVHKSQGLTFDRAILDLSGAFAPGQIYVALSRLRSLKGLVLSVPLSFNHLRTDSVVLRFSENRPEVSSLTNQLQNDILSYTINQVLKAFDLSELYQQIRYHLQSYDKDIKKSHKQKFKTWAVELLNSLTPVMEIADRFLIQVNHIVRQHTRQELDHLLARTTAAKDYFNPILKNLAEKVNDHIILIKADGKKMKTYAGELYELKMSFYRQLYHIHKAETIIKAAIDDTEPKPVKAYDGEIYGQNKKNLPDQHLTAKKTTQKTTGEKKISTRDISFSMLQEGKSVAEIASERSLAISTIEEHLLPFIKNGTLDITRLMDASKAAKILEVALRFDEIRLTPIKEILGDDFSYSEIRFALASRRDKETPSSD